MNRPSKVPVGFVSALVLAVCSLLPALAGAQTPSNSEQWIHVRVKSREDQNETVRVNVPVDMAVKVHIDSAHMDDVDLRTMLEAVRTAKDGEYVTVQSKEDDVRVAKNAGYLYIHVVEKPHNRGAKTSEGKDSTSRPSEAKESTVEVKVPMKVVDALLSAGKNELDVVAALRALSGYGNTELVTVKADDNTVRVWIDSKNVSD